MTPQEHLQIAEQLLIRVSEDRAKGGTGEYVTLDIAECEAHTALAGVKLYAAELRIIEQAAYPLQLVQP
jgi:hypothetical protein